MFRKLIRRLPLFIIVIAIGFCSCDGRKSKNDLFKASVAEFNDSIDPIQITTFYPESYREHLKDTVLSNGYSVSIKTIVDMTDSISNTYRANKTTTVKDVFRKKSSQVIVKKNDKIIFDKIIDFNFYYDNGEIPKEHLKNTLCNSVEVNQELSTGDSLYLTTDIVSVTPELYTHYFFNLKIDTNGSYTLNRWRAYENKIKHART
ncbi:hypothetical protein [Seonamhaeicola sp. ML3]|uniref:hypothetical protein n=1 Tax=Seonamhaeicola sp. ML3 TaxID=2937786 RepID=UPI00200EDD93|nr:hypothetical protein [Seonamhaeicola sp. ML3]